MMERKMVQAADGAKLSYYTTVEPPFPCRTLVCVSPIQGVEWWIPLVQNLQHHVRLLVVLV
jgi:hypothetical protein